MGDIVRKVDVCSLTAKGARGKCSTVSALVDSGASKTVISKRLADRIGGEMLASDYNVSLERRSLPLKLASVKLHARGCDMDALAVVVDNRLIARARRDVDVILGHDYLQNKHAVLRFSLKEEAQSASCKTVATVLKGARRGRRR